MKRLFASLLLGALLGAAGTWLCMVHIIDDLYMSNSSLLLANQTLLQQNESLKSQINARRLHIMQVKCVFSGAVPSFHLILEQAVQPIVQPLIGQDITAINAHTIKNLVDGRSIPLEGNRLAKLRVRLLIVAPVTELQIEYSVGLANEDDEP